MATAPLPPSVRTVPEIPLSAPTNWLPDEQVVLVDDAGQPIGVAPKSTVHGPTTPRHLAFSCYLFADDGLVPGPSGPTLAAGGAAPRLLMTHRAATKSTFPGVLTNTCCGHPAPGESLVDAATRRLVYELGIDPADVPALDLVLPDFSYRAFDGQVEENEFCPVLIGVVPAGLVTRPRADEVDDVQWWAWADVLAAAADTDSPLSAWARRQVTALDGALRAS
nr:isopentenyl-diphosphate Delta-isomerase [Nakamurella flava]